MNRRSSPERCWLGAFLVTCVVSAGCACGGKGGGPRSYAPPELSEILGHLESVRHRSRSFKVTSKMEYWIEGKRYKPTVLAMGELGARIRFNALRPTEDVARDLACNGPGFQFVDHDKDCQLSGPCTRESIAQMLRISLNPDDFLLLATGTTPIIADPQGSVEWDADNQSEVVTLTSGDGLWTQKIVLEGRNKSWDVRESTVWNRDRQVEWKLTNKDFKAVVGEDGASFRVPERTRFEQPQADAQLTVRWLEHSLNLEIDPSAYVIEIPGGLPECRSKK